jgi:DNA-binding SARP family transcriptional activator
VSKRIVPAIRLLTLGECAILTRKGRLEPTAEVAFATALYLILERNEPVWRRQLQDILWPKVSPPVRAHRLRQTLLKLRQLGIVIARPTPSQIALGQTNIAVDYEIFVADAASDIHDGPEHLAVLRGYEPRFSSPFMEWVDLKRGQIESMISRVLLDIIARNRVRGAWQQVERYALQLARLQPDNEEVTLALAEALSMRGAKSDALAILERWRRNYSGDRFAGSAIGQMQTRIADGVDPRTNRFPETPFIGREPIVSDLVCSLARAKASRGGAVVIWGEPGVGKSRLLTEFTKVASLRGAAVQRLDRRQSDRSRPLSLFQDLVPQLQQLPGAIGCAPESLVHLDRLTSERNQPAALSAEDPGVIFANIRRAVLDLLGAVSEEQLLVIWIEDTHWVDEKSAALLLETLQWCQDQRVLFVTSSREDPQEWSAQNRAITAIELKPLAETEARQIVYGVVRSFHREMSPTYLGWCVRVADGNPYFLEELANQWLEIGEQQRLPASLAGVLEERIGRLSDKTLHVLQCCALLEGNATFERLDRVLEYPPHVLLECINTLGKVGMIMLDHSSSERAGLLRSRHILLSNAALARLTPAALAYLHRRVGLILEREIDRNSSTALLWDCTHHWRESGDCSRALELARSCANHLMTLGLPSEAANAYDRALTFCSNEQERLAILELEVSSSYAASDWDTVGKLVPIVHELKRRASPPQSTHDDCELMYLRAEWRKLRWDVSLDRALRCVAAEEATVSHRVQAGYSALILLHSICDQSRMHATFNYLRELVSRSEVSRVSWLEVMMVYHTSCGDLTAGVDAAEELIARRRKSGNVGETLRALCNASITFRVAGRLNDAEQVLREAAAIAVEHHIHPALHRVLPALANLAFERDRLGDAEDCLEEMRRHPFPESDEYTALEIRAIAVRIALLRGRPEEAERLLPKDASSLRSEYVIQRRAHVAALVVATQLAISGKAREEFLEILIEAHLRVRNNPHQAFEAYVTFRALQAAGESARAEQLLSEYLRTHRREAWPPPQHIADSIRVASAR